MIIKKISPHINRKILSSVEIRNRFIEFFKDRHHCFIKSSSLEPYSDSTLEFVNAGMNQFKNAFLGLTDPPVKRAVNSQKCIRVGGKHNDLNVVGHDSYHHTFFEMLGNWSFGDYFKEEACSYALDLITSPPYSLPLERLYFTYFQGDKSLNLPPDFETKEIWLQLGVNKNRILGFGLEDNFWEMGNTGPCGPCTEIHYDHLGPEPRSQWVNKNLPDLTELWNIVFIQFKRQEDGTLEELSQNYVDTGMGLERLTALLQGSSSNYDSDLFSPLFQTIAETALVPSYQGKFGNDDKDKLDTRYRILADHSRMIAAALSDYILPEYSHSLRRVIRKSFLVADSLSPGIGLKLVLNTVQAAADSLKDHFPQINANINKIEGVLIDEDLLFSITREETKSEWKKMVEYDSRLEALTDCQSFGLIEAYNYMKTNPDSSVKPLPVDETIICYDRYGLNISLIEQLANIKGYSVDRDGFNDAIQKLKDRNKLLLSATVPTNKPTLKLADIKKTDDHRKFVYHRDSKIGKYSIEKLHSAVLKAWIDDTVVKEGQQILYGSNINILLSSTNFNSPLKSCDKPLGHMILTGPSGRQAHFTVLEVQRTHSWIIHKGFIIPLSDSKDEPVVYEKWSAECCINVEALESLMRNTTAALLVDSYLKNNYSSVMALLNCQTDHFFAKFHLYGSHFKYKDALQCEEVINNCISDCHDFSLQTLSNKDMLSSTTHLPYLNPYLKWYQELSSNGAIKMRAVTSTPNIINLKDISQVCLTRFHTGKKNIECSISGVAGPDMKKILSESTYDIINALNSKPDKSEFANLVKTAKNKMSNNQVPLDMEPILKKAVDQSRVSQNKKVRR